MTVTRRFAALCALAFLVTVFAAILLPKAAVFVFISANILLALLLLWDLWITPGESAVEITRPAEQKLYLGEENKLEIRVRNRFTRVLSIALRDNLPGRHFTVTEGVYELRVEPDETAAFGYTCVPRKRGSFPSDGVRVRIRGLLGLCVKQFELPTGTDYKVYPGLRDLSRYRLAAARRLRDRGDRTIRQRGFGEEFDCLRDFVEGDDYRKINWMATARERRLVVNSYEAERNQPVFIMLDTGRPLSYAAGGYKKLDYAVNAALILADIVNQMGDNCGLVTFNTAVTAFVPPAKGLAHRELLMETLYHTQDSREISDYEGVFLEFARRQPRRSLIFIFTDFETADETRDIAGSLGILTRKHVPIIISMRNAFAETAAGSEDMYLKGAAFDYLAGRAEIIRLLNRSASACIETTADKLTLTAVNRYLAMK